MPCSRIVCSRDLANYPQCIPISCPAWVYDEWEPLHICRVAHFGGDDVEHNHYWEIPFIGGEDQIESPTPSTNSSGSRSSSSSNYHPSQDNYLNQDPSEDEDSQLKNYSELPENRDENTIEDPELENISDLPWNRDENQPDDSPTPSRISIESNSSRISIRSEPSAEEEDDSSEVREDDREDSDREDREDGEDEDGSDDRDDSDRSDDDDR